MDPLPLHDLNQSHPQCTLRSCTITLADRCDLQMHYLEAFLNTTSNPISLPLILLLHGFPELAYSWRKIISPLATAHGGYRVVAPDLRGYGRTVVKGQTAQIQYDDPLAPFHNLNKAEDICSLVKALGHESVAMIVGHDFGSFVAGHCVTAYPQLFRSVVFMSVPFAGVEKPPLPPKNDDSTDATRATNNVALGRALPMALAELIPPRLHYVVHFSSCDTNEDLLGQGLEDVYHFLGRYYYMKSGAWEGNTAHPLPCAADPFPTIDAIARDLGSLPDYYIMPADETMRQVIDRHAAQNPHFTWPPEETKAGWVYASEFTRTGFQGGLNGYRTLILPPPEELVDRLTELSQGSVSIPAAFVSGARDWGVFQKPGEVERMKFRFGVQDDDVVMIEGAGHWVQQEAPDRVMVELLRFLDKVQSKTKPRL